MTVGDFGTGDLTIEDGGTAIVGSSNSGAGTFLGVGSNTASGTITVTGENSKLTSYNALFVGQDGTGTLNVLDKAAVQTGQTRIGANAGASGQATVNGGGSQWTNNNQLYVGYDGAGELTVSNGGKVSSYGGYLGYHSKDAHGSATITGGNSTWDAGSSYFYVGNLGTGSLAIEEGGKLTNGNDGFVGNNPNNTNVSLVSISGTGSSWESGGTLYIGAGGRGSLSVTGEGQVSADSITLGQGSGGVGRVILSGAGSKLSSANNILVGDYGLGSLTVSTGSEVSVNSGTGTITLGNQGNGDGILNIGAEADKDAAALGTLSASVVKFGAGTGTLVFNHTQTGSGYSFTPMISGGASSKSAEIVQAGGHTILSGDVSGYGGKTTVSGGTLTLPGSIGGGDITIETDGTFVFDQATNLGFANVISGAGALVKTGAGTTGLNGDTSGFTGSATVSQGILTATKAFNASSYDIASGAVLILDQSTDQTYAPTITGAGKLMKVGAGTVTLNGDGSAFTGETAIDIGPLKITGKHSGSTVYVAYANGNTASLIVEGRDAVLKNTGGTFRIGVFGDGEATISGGARLETAGFTISRTAQESGDYGSGKMTVTGKDTVWTSSAGGQIGFDEDSLGELIISDGAQATISNTGIYVGGQGSVRVTDAGTSLTTTNPVDPEVGAWFDVSGGGTASIEAGASLLTDGIYVSSAGTDLSTMTITGPDTEVSAIVRVYVGGQSGNPGSGNGALTVSDGAAVTTATGGVGMDPGSTGTMVLTGGNSSFSAEANPDVNALGNFYVSYGGTGTLTLSNGAALSADNEVRIARVASGAGTLNIGAAAGDPAMAAPASLTAKAIAFGDGTGKLVLNHTGTFGLTPDITGNGSIDQYAGTTVLSGDGSGFTGATTVDGGDLRITNAFGSSSGYIGDVSGSNGTVTVAGADASWTNTGALYVGNDGVGNFSLQNGGSVSNGVGVLGYWLGSTGRASVRGSGGSGTASSWTNNGDFYVGSSGQGFLKIMNGGQVSVTGGSSGYIGYTQQGTGEVTVTGAGSALIVSDALRIGETGVGTLTIADGGRVVNTSAYIGFTNGPATDGTVTVTGDGSTWENKKNLYVGLGDTGKLTVADGGVVSANSGTGIVSLGYYSTGDGKVNIGAVSGDPAVAPGTIDAAEIRFDAGAGTLVFNHTGTDYQFAPNITGGSGLSATIEHLAGTTLLSGNGSSFAGETKVSGGTLLVTGSLGDETSTVTVSSGGTLGGSGTVGGAVTVDGTLSAGTSPGMLTIGGDLTMQTGSTSAFELSSPGIVGGSNNDLVSVGGNLTLAGTLQASVASAGYYRLFDYGGSLSGAFGSTNVTGLPGASVDVQTAIDGQVNLAALGPGQTMQFWDGVDATGDGTVEGGSGTWSASNTNWTGAPGQAEINGAWASSVGVFMGSAGTVAVSDTQAFDTLQFKTDGYLLTGGSLAFAPATGSASTINIDGGVTTTVASTLTDGSATRLVKQGGGTLILSGASTYTGGTEIAAGTLQVGNDAALGESSGGLTLAGGVFATTGSFTSARAVDLAASGTIVPASGTTLELAGVVSGSSPLIKQGEGTLVLSGANSYSGGTQIDAGTLQVASDSNLGDASGDLTVAGGTLQTTGSFTSARSVTLAPTSTLTQASGTTLELTGVVSGAGALRKDGEGTLTLSGTNTYTGPTQVAAGRLVGNTASIMGGVENAATVEFAQGVDGTFAGDIGGLNGTDGAMVKSGVGTLTLAGTSTLDWSVLGGSLVSTTDLFLGNVMVGSGTSLVFDQNFDGDYAGAVTGSGDVLYTGGGEVTLTGDNSGYTGETTVENFTLTLSGTLGGTLLLGNGGSLAGNGTVGSTIVRSGGMITPGNSIGSITVAGDLLFEAGSTYQVETEPGGTDADLVHATGTITIEGGQVAHIGFDGNYAGAASYTILSADGGITGTFADVSSTLAFLDPSLDYASNAVYLTLVRNDVDFTAVAETPNQTATAAAVDGLGTANDIYRSVVTLDAAGARQAYDALSGEIHASLKTGLVEDSRIVREAALSRVQAAFSTLGGEGSTAIAYGGNGAIAEPAPVDQSFAAWGQVFGSWGSSDGNGNAAKLDRDTAGFLVGGDAAVGGFGRVGFLTGYQSSTYQADARASKADATSYHLGLYGGTDLYGLNLRGGASYTWSDIDTARTAAFPGFSQYLTGSTNAGTSQVFGEAGYEVGTGWAAFEPFAGLAYVSVSTDAYAESGGSAALSVQSDTTEVTYSTVGVRASATIPMSLASAQAKVTGLLGWRHAFGSLDPTATNAFAGGSAFTVEGVPIAEDVAVVGAGLEFDLGAVPMRGISGATLGVFYDGQFGSDLVDNAATGRLTIEF
ncbi:autotransporter domain-containing protein [Amorphus sp. 3PC139-8]|uniref:autotransporter domain-containing protein n=1 Tax=Amorphus sp. 3PC139-8 TaxID=2735676 RepID=UPI00345C9D04